MPNNRARILWVFALHGMVVSGLLARLPEIQLAGAIPEGAYGLALAGIPLGVFTGSLLIGGLIEHFGTRRVMMVAHPGIAFSMVPAGFATDAVGLFAAMVVFGWGMAASNVAMNVEADRVELATGAKIMNKCHGAWGVGSLVWASIVPLTIRAGISPLAFYTATFAVVAAGALLALARMTESPPRAAAAPALKRRVAMPNRGTFLVVGFALTALCYEGVIRNWGVIYLRDSFGAAPSVAALALPALLIMHTAVRLLADRVIERWGDVAVGRTLTAIAFLGMAGLVTTQTAPLALAAIALIGLGVSTGWPQGASAAARRGDRPASENVAAYSILQTLVVFVVPPITGLVAQGFGLRLALLLFLPVPLISIFFAGSLAPRPVPAQA